MHWHQRSLTLTDTRGAQEKVGEFLATFKEYPPRQTAASFTIDQVLETLQQSHGK